MRRQALRIPCSLVAAALSWFVGDSVRAEPASPWGVSPSAELCAAPASWAASMATLGVTWVRGFEDRPEGAGLRPLVDAGLAVSGTLWWSPPGSVLTFPVKDLPGFRQYVLERVTRFKGVVHNWEVWNEPPNFTADPSPVSYGRTVAAAYDAAKSVDPSVQIGLAAKSTDISFLAASIDGGARGKYDYVTLHPYETAELLPQGWEGPFLGIVAGVRAMLRDKDPVKAQVPIWFTEIGLEAAENGRKGVSVAVQADSLVKIYVMSLAQGVTHIHWFDPRDSEGKAHGLLRGDGSQRPAMVAFSNLVRFLGRVPSYSGALTLAPDTYGFLFNGPSGDVVVAWSKPGLQKSIKFAASLTIVQPGSGEMRVSNRAVLTSSPTLFVTDSNGAQSKIWRDAAKATLPAWDGGASNQSASLTAGQKPQGIHMIDAAPKKLGNRPLEFDLSGTTGARFAVDPAFYLYEGGPIRITAVVRAHEKGRAGFSLKYEANGPVDAVDGQGMIGAGTWNTVTGEAPATLSWEIRDARFVGKYGANFAINCDGPEFCNFSVLSVKVTKL